MIYINITSFIPISQLEKDHSMIETCRLKKNFFFEKKLSLVNSIKVLKIKNIFSNQHKKNIKIF